jgi:hypothetical protein
VICLAAAWSVTATRPPMQVVCNKCCLTTFVSVLKAGAGDVKELGQLTVCHGRR